MKNYITDLDISMLVDTGMSPKGKLENVEVSYENGKFGRFFSGLLPQKVVIKVTVVQKADLRRLFCDPIVVDRHITLVVTGSTKMDPEELEEKIRNSDGIHAFIHESNGFGLLRLRNDENWTPVTGFSIRSRKLSWETFTGVLDIGGCFINGNTSAIRFA